MSELRPFKVKDNFFQCIFEALFINSANALLLTAVKGKQCLERQNIFLDWLDTLILFKGKAFTVFELMLVSNNIFSKIFHLIVWYLLWAAKKSDKLLPSSKSDGFQCHNHNRCDYFCSTTETDYFPMFFRWKIIANNVLRWLSIICPTMRWNCCIGQV